MSRPKLRITTLCSGLIAEQRLRQRAASATVASIPPVWSSPGRVWEGRSVDVCCGLVGLAGRLGTRTGGAQGADRTGVRQGRNTGDRWSFSRRLAVRGYAQDGLASG